MIDKNVESPKEKNLKCERNGENLRQLDTFVWETFREF